MKYIPLSLALFHAAAAFGAPSSATFQSVVEPVLAATCASCHNDRVESGGLNLSPFSAPSSIADNREGWEKILRKIRSGEMPPKGVPRPPAAQIDDLTKFVQAEFERA